MSKITSKNSSGQQIAYVLVGWSFGGFLGLLFSDADHQLFGQTAGMIIGLLAGIALSIYSTKPQSTKDSKWSLLLLVVLIVLSLCGPAIVSNF